MRKHSALRRWLDEIARSGGLALSGSLFRGTADLALATEMVEAKIKHAQNVLGVQVDPLPGETREELLDRIMRGDFERPLP